MSDRITAAMFDKLSSIIRSGKRLVIFLHDNPDPDTLASGWILARMAELFGVSSKIVYGGILGRAENRTMVRLLKIPAHRLERRPTRFRKTDIIALVDTQPGAGNNSFPENRRAHIVIDHHPSPRKVNADFVDVNPAGGCCATRVFEYARVCGLVPDASLATAIAYAVISETQDLGREATEADTALYLEMIPRVRLPVLGVIRHPARDREYFRTIARAMQSVQVARHTGVCHIGTIPYPEVVAEIADFLVAMERITWVLVTGLTDKGIVLSIRTTNPKGNAEQVMRRILRGLGRGGGHGVMAGGFAPLADEQDPPSLRSKITARFLKALPYRRKESLKPLVT